MYKILDTHNISNLQGFIESVYGLPDNRLYSISDLLSNQQRFTMRALKGIRKGNKEKLKYNLLIALAWHIAVANRLHVNLEEKVWQRFPMLCSYCGRRPCECKVIKPTVRPKTARKESLKPKSIKGVQDMFEKIYPSQTRTLADAGVHLAEEMGEVNEAIHVFLGEHKEKQFSDITDELADYVSCIMGVANSAKIDVASELASIFSNNCHVCHKAPCQCKFSYVAKFSS